MTDEEIKKIAREYAEYCCRETDYEGDIVERNMDLHICSNEVAMPLLEWLSERFCIVPREVVFKEHEDAVAEGNHFHVKHQIQSRTRLRTLESIFGKDMFEEEGK